MIIQCKYKLDEEVLLSFIGFRYSEAYAQLMGIPNYTIYSWFSIHIDSNVLNQFCLEVLSRVL